MEFETAVAGTGKVFVAIVAAGLMWFLMERLAHWVYVPWPLKAAVAVLIFLGALQTIFSA